MLYVFPKDPELGVVFKRHKAALFWGAHLWGNGMRNVQIVQCEHKSKKKKLKNINMLCQMNYLWLRAHAIRSWTSLLGFPPETQQFIFVRCRGHWFLGISHGTVLSIRLLLKWTSWAFKAQCDFLFNKDISFFLFCNTCTLQGTSGNCKCLFKWVKHEQYCN